MEEALDVAWAVAVSDWVAPSILDVFVSDAMSLEMEVGGFVRGYAGIVVLLVEAFVVLLGHYIYGVIAAGLMFTGSPFGVLYWGEVF